MITHVGQRVQLKYSLAFIKATVTRVNADGFRVQYDDHPDWPRKKGDPRARQEFSWKSDHLFAPEGSEVVRVIEDSKLDIPLELLRRYGIPID